MQKCRNAEARRFHSHYTHDMEVLKDMRFLKGGITIEYNLIDLTQHMRATFWRLDQGKAGR